MANYAQSSNLADVRYDIRGPILQRAEQLEAEGQQILKLNIGNPAPFGFEAPDPILADMIKHLPHAQGYSESRGILSARTAIAQYYETRGFTDLKVENIYLGNGVSELISMTLQALLNDGDEVLIPAPDYPLWTATVSLCGGTPVHYLCDEEQDWQPDLADLESKITEKTRGLVLINPNNPTGAVYSKQTVDAMVELARKHNLVVFSDEIYEKILFDDAVHYNTALSAGEDVLCLTFSGLSKAYRVCGYRAGWVVVTGPIQEATDYLAGLNLLSNMRLCPNVPAQYAIEAALSGHQSINDLVLPGGRLREQRDLAYRMLNEIPGVSTRTAKGALYMFPKLDPDVYPIKDDEKFVLDLLEAKKLLVSHGTGFNWASPDHFRLAILPAVDVLEEAIGRIGDFLSSYRP